MRKLQKEHDFWLHKIVRDQPEDCTARRCTRVVEEVAELAQALGVKEAACHSIVQHVYSRPPGDVQNELAGVLLTALGVASAHGVDAAAALIFELSRVGKPEMVERIRRRQAEKDAVAARPFVTGAEMKAKILARLRELIDNDEMHGLSALDAIEEIEAML